VPRACFLQIPCEALVLGWFRALMPKEQRFFDLFTRHAQLTLAAARALSAMLKGGDDVLRYCREVTNFFPSAGPRGSFGEHLCFT